MQARTLDTQTVRAQAFPGNIGFVIPTYNAGPYWDRFHAALERQGVPREQVLVIDSSSTDSTRRSVKSAGYALLEISQASFRHGGTRQMAADSLPWAEILVFLTQDAIPCGAGSIDELLRAFKDPQVGAAYGRQLPREGAGPVERHARLFNYSERSEVRTFESRERLGFKAAFLSNSFAAYRRAALEAVGGFPRDAIICEDTTVAGRLLIDGWKIAYQAEATVIHSHALSVRSESSRYFDIGVHHGREKWLLDAFGGAGGEGRAFVMSELRFLLKSQPAQIPGAFIRNLSKWVAYQLGLHEKHLPRMLKEFFSTQPSFWRKDGESSFSPEPRVAARRVH
jgi:rhamnosyltransferase